MDDKAYAKRILNNYMNPQNGSDEAAEIEVNRSMGEIMKKHMKGLQ